jgi:hypothetical protein
MESGFKDGSGARCNPSMIRAGMGAGDAVRDVLLDNQVDAILSENMDMARLESSISGYKMVSDLAVLLMEKMNVGHRSLRLRQADASMELSETATPAPRTRQTRIEI